MSEPLLTIDRVSKRYGTYEALREVSLTVQAGKVLGLLGPNGTGKTTLSSIITTLRPPTSGDLLWQGKSIYQDIAAYRAQIGFCPQRPNLNGLLTVRENLRFAGTYYGMTAGTIAQRIDQLATQLRFADYLDAKPSTLSGGYKQRVLFARALMHNPKLVIFDEPTSALDPHIRRQIWEVITQIKAQGTAIILTTHYLDEAEFLSDTVCVLDKGQVRLIDTPANLLSTYQKGRLEDVFLHLMEEKSE